MISHVCQQRVFSFAGQEGRQHMVQLAGELLLNAGAVAEDKADFPSRDD